MAEGLVVLVPMLQTIGGTLRDVDLRGRAIAAALLEALKIEWDCIHGSEAARCSDEEEPLPQEEWCLSCEITEFLEKAAANAVFLLSAQDAATKKKAIDPLWRAMAAVPSMLIDRAKYFIGGEAHGRSEETNREVAFELQTVAEIVRRHFAQALGVAPCPGCGSLGPDRCGCVVVGGRRIAAVRPNQQLLEMWLREHAWKRREAERWARDFLASPSIDQDVREALKVMAECHARAAAVYDEAMANLKNTPAETT